ncbi:PH domain-containing protein [Corynebacterium propinquum]|uniref:PH domain-containing protein n=1 Tax=Corynebacterium propinquum TaxID=43769 RepID=A0AAP4BUT3_9CORY|nr:PH domain-containing protein [Corynebacterium propinquum]MCG7231571.1 PH domain-containing protein [Corynebacterium propinquum]MDK4234362.1 PH domain-containing protein [Corynebacterium propinquum]MDK4292527.1 PH domain-containing protein [Corynebacterium propinquum]MDK4300049.1 PH domain-containing protein [Corynebacterium propinquum]MDK4313639.1 PH domain-containing protein [Corynebacterium propinquum]
MNPVSMKLIKARYLSGLPWAVLFIGGSIAAAVFWSSWLWIATAVIVAFVLFRIWLIPRQVKLLGWKETDDELLITRGKIWHTFTVVPYGRIQFVDVSAGPIDKLFGLKNVKLHTASSSSDSDVPGLAAVDADALRQRLSEKARERMSGL